MLAPKISLDLGSPCCSTLSHTQIIGVFLSFLLFAPLFCFILFLSVLEIRPCAKQELCHLAKL